MQTRPSTSSAHRAPSLRLMTPRRPPARTGTRKTSSQQASRLAWALSPTTYSLTTSPFPTSAARRMTSSARCLPRPTSLTTRPLPTRPLSGSQMQCGPQHPNLSRPWAPQCSLAPMAIHLQAPRARSAWGRPLHPPPSCKTRLSWPRSSLLTSPRSKALPPSHPPTVASRHPHQLPLPQEAVAQLVTRQLQQLPLLLPLLPLPRRPRPAAEAVTQTRPLTRVPPLPDQVAPLPPPRVRVLPPMQSVGLEQVVVTSTMQWSVSGASIFAVALRTFASSSLASRTTERLHCRSSITLPHTLRSSKRKSDTSLRKRTRFWQRTMRYVPHSSTLALSLLSDLPLCSINAVPVISGCRPRHRLLMLAPVLCCF
eukprot:m.113799 g.113799  ORF g.113799 m.113799 type:complete len:368 (-) comp9429_c0_seq5:3007-4110(-)